MTTRKFLTSVTNMLMKASMEIWGTCKIRDLGSWAAGSAFPREFQGKTGLKYLFCKVGDMNRPENDVYIYTTQNTIDEYTANRIKAKIHPAGTVIFPKIGGAIATNKRRILIKESAIDNNCLGIIPNRNIDQTWLYHYLNSIDFSRYQSGTSVPSLRQSVIGDINAPLVSKNAQKQIAAFLTWLKEKTPSDTWNNSPSLPLKLKEKKRIVERYDILMQKYDEISRLRRESINELGNLLEKKLVTFFFENKNLNLVKLGNTEYFVINPKASELNDLDKDFEVSFVPMRYVDDIQGKIMKSDTRKLSEVRRGYTYFKEGDVIFAKITPCMENGKTAVARSLRNGVGFGSTEFHVIRVLHDVVPEWVYYFFRTKRFRQMAKKSMTGTAGHKRVPRRFLENYLIPLPAFDIQLQTVKYLNLLRAKVDELRKHQINTGEAVQKLISSLIDRMFLN